MDTPKSVQLLARLYHTVMHSHSCPFSLTLIPSLSFPSLTRLMQALLEALASAVSEGHLAFAELAGMPPLSLTQQASRWARH